MAKAEDITKSEVYQRVVQDQIKEPSKFEQVIDIFGQFKNLVDNKVSSNIENLQGKGVFDKTRAVSFLEKIDGINQKYEDIDNNYGGNTKAYARAELKRGYDAELLSRLPAGSFKEGDVINLNRPDAFYGENFEKQVNERAKMYDDYRITFRDVAEKYNTGKGGADELVLKLENDLKRATKVTGLDLITNFGNKDYYKTAFTGEGLLDKIESDNIYEKDISTIDMVNQKFKALFRQSPAAATKFEELVKDVRINEEQIAIDNTRREQKRIDNKTGRETTVTVMDYKITYRDQNGRKQTEVITEPVRGTDPKRTENDVNNVMVYSNLIKPEGQREFNRLLNEQDYTPKRAYAALSENVKKTYSEIRNENLRKENMSNLQELFKNHKEEFYFEEKIEGINEIKTLRDDIKEYQKYKSTGKYEGTTPPTKPAFYYDNIEDFISVEHPEYAKFNEVSQSNFNLETRGLILNSTFDNSPEYIATFKELEKPEGVYNQIINNLIPEGVSEEELSEDYFIEGTRVFVNPMAAPLRGIELNEVFGTQKFNPREEYNLGYNFETSNLEAISTGEFEPEIIFQDSRALGEMSPASRKLLAETKAKINSLTERRKRNTEKLKLIEEGKTTGPSRKGTGKSTLLKRNEELNKEIEGLIDTVNRLEVPIKPAGITVETP